MDASPGSRACPIDFDHESAMHADNWPEEFREMRAKCPVAWTEKHGGYWVASSYEAVVSIAQDGATFSSHKEFDPETGEVIGGITIPATPIPRGLPVESDRPEWEFYRNNINRRFAPKAAEALRGDARLFATALLNRVIESGEMDLVNDLTGPVPAMVTMKLMGLPLSEWREFADPLHEMVFTPKESAEFPGVIASVQWVFQRCVEEFERYKSIPQEDNLLSYFAHEAVEGHMLTSEEVLNLCNNIITGGVDTTTALTTHALSYLHDNPADKQRLIGDPSLLPIAREEFLRFYTPIHCLARNVTHDVTLAGA